jgi:hypothetical protein
LKKDEIDLGILSKLLVVLKLIEIGKLDQHEGSYEVGKLLKQIYVDSALRKAEHLDKNHAPKPKVHAPTAAPKNISWSQYKKTNPTIAEATNN